VIVRINTTKITPDAFFARMDSDGIQCEQGLLPASAILHTGNIAALAAFDEGLFHVQDVSSQLCCEILSPQPGERILDACAAPGGKSFTLAEMMGDTGEIIAFDLHENRVTLIESGARRLGLKSVHADVNDASKYDPASGSFDGILCDVPCSGLGVLRKKPEIRYKAVTFLDNLPEMQYSILRTSARSLKPGGALVYSTCTLRPAENESIAKKFLSEHPDFSPLDITPILEKYGINSAFGDQYKNRITLMPHIHNTDGFFIAAFIRNM